MLWVFTWVAYICRKELYMELLFNFNPFNAGFIRLPPVNITYLHSGNEIDINCPLPYVRMSTSWL